VIDEKKKSHDELTGSRRVGIIKRLTLDDHDSALDECDSNGTVAQHIGG
jgi:hypothetical protein